MDKTGPDISIIIVNYNAGPLLRNCVASIRRHIQVNYEIIVVDNDSHDDSIRQLEEIKPEFEGKLSILHTGANLGFGAANNLGANRAAGQYLHFLNPDSLVGAETEEAYGEILKRNTEAVFVTGLRNQKGQPQKMQHLIPTLGNYWKSIFNRKKSGYWNIGASVIIHRVSFRKLGGWDEDYFMYAEDLDFFYRIHKLNIPVIYTRGFVTHIGRGTSSGVWNDLQRARKIERSTFRFYRKHGMGYQYPLVRMIQMVYLLRHEPENFGISWKAFMHVLFGKNNGN